MVKTKTGILIGILVSILLARGLTSARAESPTTAFFPRGVFSTNAEADRLNAVHYAKYLQALREPGLYGLKNDSKVIAFRFLCLRPFEQPFVIRLEALASGGGKLYYKATDGDGAYRPGNLTTDKIVKLTKTQMQDCLSRIADSGFWEMPGQVANLDGCDGPQWMLEGVQNGKYHLVERQSPRLGRIRSFGIYLAELSGQKLRNLD